MSSEGSSTHTSLYKTLRHEVEEIRLIKIELFDPASEKLECSIETVQLATTPPYDALSYMWGDSSITKEITVNGLPIMVTENLWAALIEFWTRPRSTRLLWIDALCINQLSVLEKNHQVPLMGKIYSQARGVLMWLGVEQDNSPLGMAIIKRWGQGIHAARVADLDELLSAPLKTALRFIEDPFDVESLTAAKHLLSRDYWKRIWIIQEVVLARNRLIICGKDDVDYNHFHHVHAYWTDITHLNKENSISPELATRITNGGITGHTSITAIRRLMLQKAQAASKKQPWKPDILFLISNFPASVCTDPRDKIFGFFGFLTEQEFPLEPDYNLTMEEATKALTTGIIRDTNRLNCVSLAGIGFSENEKLADRSYPSWAFDFSAFRQNNFLSLNRGSFYATKSSSAQCFISQRGHLTAAAILCDEITEVINPVSENLLPTSGLDWVWNWFELAAVCEVIGHPTRIPWRQAFFRTLIADSSPPGCAMASFEGEEEKGPLSLLNRAEGFLTLMRLIALWKVKGFLANGETEIFDSDLLLMDYCLLPIPKLLEEQHIDEDTAYWIRNSSTTSDPTLRERALDEFCGPSDSSRRLIWSLEEYACSPQTMNFHWILLGLRGLLSNRSFFMTSKGYMGLGPRYTQKGDKICVLLGCSVPIVIRKAATNFLVVGDTYVYGMMQGEMMDLTEKGDLQVEDMTLE
jgi:hypothetical protein